MTDTNKPTVQECAKFLDKFISGHTGKMHNDYKEFQPAYEKEIEMFTEIKERLLLVDKLNKIIDEQEDEVSLYRDKCLEFELAKTQSPDELVEKMLQVGLLHSIDLRHSKFNERAGKREEAKAEISKLLQSRQPEKPDIVHHKVGKGGVIKVPFPLLRQPEKLTVTIKEIEDILVYIEGIDNEETETPLGAIKYLFKSKGFEVLEK